MPGLMIGIWLARAVVGKRRPLLHSESEWAREHVAGARLHTFNHPTKTPPLTRLQHTMKHLIYSTVAFGLLFSDAMAGVLLKSKDGGIVDCAAVFAATPAGLLVATAGKPDGETLGWDTLALERLAAEQPEINAAYLEAMSAKTPQRLYLGKAAEYVKFGELPDRLKNLFGDEHTAKKNAAPQVALRALRALRDAADDKAKARELERYKLKRGYGIEEVLAQMETMVGHLPPAKILKRSAEEQSMVSKTAKFIVTVRILILSQSVTKEDQFVISEFMHLTGLD
jgi:hypothetical protein